MTTDVCWCGHPSHGGWCSSGRPEPCECWVGDPRPIIAAERARIAGSVMEVPAVEVSRAEWNPDWISRAAVLAIVEHP